MLGNISMKKAKTWLRVFYAYITLTGTIMFGLFILEEAFQTTMFATWPAKDVKQWEIVYDGCKLMKSITVTLKVVNYTIGYIQPIAFIAYRKFAQSADYYIKALRSEIFANRPDLFVNEYVNFNFVPNEIRNGPDNSLFLINRKIRVICRKSQKSRNMSISGILKVSSDGTYCYVDIRKKE